MHLDAAALTCCACAVPPSLAPHSPYQLKEGCHEADVVPPVAQPLPLLTGAAAALAWQLLLARPTCLLVGCFDVHMDISRWGCWLLVAARRKPVLALAVGVMRVGLVVACGCVWLACVQHMLLLRLLLLMPLGCGCQPLCAVDTRGRLPAACWPLAAAVAGAAGGAACCCCCQLFASEHDRHLVQCLPVQQPGPDLKQGACTRTHTMHQCQKRAPMTETCVTSQLRSEGTICASWCCGWCQQLPGRHRARRSAHPPPTRAATAATLVAPSSLVLSPVACSA